jgi:hypothetical protein
VNTVSPQLFLIFSVPFSLSVSLDLISIPSIPSRYLICGCAFHVSIIASLLWPSYLHFRPLYFYSIPVLLFHTSVIVPFVALVTYIGTPYCSVPYIPVDTVPLFFT